MDKIKPVLTSCAFTGHRPTRFLFQYNENHPACIAFKRELTHQIERLYRRGVRNFYTSCALGSALWAGEAVLSLAFTQVYSDIKLFCVVPFQGQESRWKPELQQRYRTLLERSTDRFILHETYTQGCYFECNRFLIDHTDVLLAVYDGKENPKSGTDYTVQYARKNRKPVLCIHPDTLAVFTYIPRK